MDRSGKLARRAPTGKNQILRPFAFQYQRDVVTNGSAHAILRFASKRRDVRSKDDVRQLLQSISLRRLASADIQCRTRQPSRFQCLHEILLIDNLPSGGINEIGGWL